MSFFSSLGSMFGFGAQPTASVSTPNWLTPQYQQSLENDAQAVQNQQPVYAQEVLNQANQANLSNANAMAASARGNINPALLQRQTMQQLGQANAQTAQQAGVIGAQEQIANQQLAQQYRQMELGATETAAQQTLGAQQANAGIQQANAQRGSQLLGGLLGAGATLGAGALMGPAAGMAGKIGTSALGTGASDLTSGISNGAVFASRGGHVPGKPKVFGDDERNDTVPAMLSPGEIVVPRTKAKDPDKAKAFIDALMAKKNKYNKGGYAEVLHAKKKLQGMKKK